MPGTGQRWGGQARPGDLTGALGRRNQQEAAKKAEEAKQPADADEIRRAALAEGIDAGWDRGWDAGYTAAVEDFKNAGIDTDAVLALAEDDE
jgi:hypothetical protein